MARVNLAVWPGYSTAVSAINGGVPGPTIRVQLVQEFAARIENDHGEPLVLHRHGVLAPERMDGHPRDQVAAGQSDQVRFPIRQRASTCWYHAHADQLTAEQAYAGVAGFLIVGHKPHQDCKGKVLGILAVADTIRPNAIEAIKALHAAGVEKVVISSGDNQRTVDAISKRVGLTRQRAIYCPSKRLSASAN